MKIILFVELRDQALEQSIALSWGMLLRFSVPVCSFLNEDRNNGILYPPYKLCVPFNVR